MNWRRTRTRRYIDFITSQTCYQATSWILANISINTFFACQKLISLMRPSSVMKRKLDAYATKRVAAGFHQSPWLFELAKHAGDKNYWLSCSLLPQCERSVLLFTREWTWTHNPAETGGEHWWGLGPVSTLSELSHLAMLINFFAWGKKQLDRASFEPGTSGPKVRCCAVTPHWLDYLFCNVVYLT